MTSRSRQSLRHGAGTILMVLGVLFWMLTVVFPLTALHFRLFAWLDHSEKLSLAVVAGGASLAGGIIFLLAPRRRRRRRYYDEEESFGSLAHPASPTRRHWASPIARNNFDLGDTETAPLSHLRDMQ
jgi:hypothetical protein